MSKSTSGTARPSNLSLSPAPAATKNAGKATQKTSARQKKAPSTPESIRCVCSTSDPGHMLECEQCLCWSHCKCVGISASLAASYPFVCPFCIKSLFSELSAIKAKVADTQARVAHLETSVNEVIPAPVRKELQNVSSTLSQISLQIGSNTSLNPRPLEPPSTTPAASVRANSDSALTSSSQPNPDSRKFNVLLFGISEQQHGLSRSTRQSNDFESVASIISGATGNSHGVRDCRRLGKYNRESSRSRPILVSLNSTEDVRKLLSSRRSLPDHIRAKPDLSPDERQVEALLLKERWRLISSGELRQAIRIRGSSIFLNNNLHGRVINSTFKVFLSPDSIPPEVSNDIGNNPPASIHHTTPSQPVTTEPVQTES